MGYRLLTDREVSLLSQQDCYADNWSDITVKEGFNTHRLHHVTFSGKIKLGVFEANIEIEKGISKPSGLYNCSIRQCDIGDNVYLYQVGQISNYIIDDNVIIMHTGSVSVLQETSFGNGVEIEVLNETGGRDLVISDCLSAQLAYLCVFYRHDPVLMERLKSMILAYTATKKSSTGMIGSHASIRYNGVLRNVNIGSHAVVSGSLLVDEASIVSNKYAPVIIGAGVIIKKSIILSGSSVTGGANIEKCFVGQGVTIGKQFSAENCALFANTEVMLGEGLSLFAGPYTVSHHKASLLLGGMFSFYNAGSGTNISNHMYKLGPLHQGIVERGSKTGSSSYLLWPCRVGAYSVVVGKHFTNFDTSDFPFSYITEEKSKSHLYPAMNLFTVGTRRDSEKWPARDKRNDPDKLDLINFSLFNPYIAGKMVNAWRLLGELADKALKTQEYVNYKGIQISRLLLKTSRKFYEMALKVYIGGELAEQLETETGVVSLTGMRKKLAPEGNFWQGEWRDLSGLFAPAVKIDELTDKIKDGKIDTIEQVLEAFREVHKNYKLFAWNWCAGRIESETGTKLNDVSKEMLVQIINDWQVNATRLNCMILQDASKEFDATSRYGYGIDGDEKIRNLDFEAVRGSYEGNKFVKSLKADTADIEKRAARLLEIIKTCN